LRRPKRRYIGGYVTEDDAYLVISAKSTYGNELYIKDLKTPNSPIVTIVDNFNSDNSVIATEGKLFIETDLKAPNKRIVTVDFSKPTHQIGLIIAETDVFVAINRCWFFCQLHERCRFSSKAI
jgi:hypothetical protein